jgi:hypothetical protein
MLKGAAACAVLAANCGLIYEPVDMSLETCCFGRHGAVADCPQAKLGNVLRSFLKEFPGLSISIQPRAVALDDLSATLLPHGALVHPTHAFDRFPFGKHGKDFFIRRRLLRGIVRRQNVL